MRLFNGPVRLGTLTAACLVALLVPRSVFGAELIGAAPCERGDAPLFLANQTLRVQVDLELHSATILGSSASSFEDVFSLSPFEATGGPFALFTTGSGTVFVKALAYRTLDPRVVELMVPYSAGWDVTSIRVFGIANDYQPLNRIDALDVPLGRIPEPATSSATSESGTGLRPELRSGDNCFLTALKDSTGAGRHWWVCSECTFVIFGCGWWGHWE